MYVKKFAENLRSLIGSHSISYVAKQIGIPQQTLSSYVWGQKEIKLEMLCKIADYFDEDIDVLVGRREY